LQQPRTQRPTRAIGNEASGVSGHVHHQRLKDVLSLVLAQTSNLL
jgi:hypothetical protein